MTDYLRSIALGLVQGLTEFIPVSSTAHLRIVPALLGWPDPGAAFAAVIQLGTMLAIFVYFRVDLWRITRSTLLSDRSADARLGRYILGGTVPLAAFGIVFADQIENGARNLRLIAAALIVVGVLLFVAEKASKKSRDISSFRLLDAAVIGLAQAAALIPGVSRSGSTITAGLFLGFTRESAARYSFLLSVPAVVLSGLFELKDIGIGALSWGPTLVAAMVAFVSGYLSIAGLLRFLATRSTSVFTAYRVILGVVVLALVSSNTIS